MFEGATFKFRGCTQTYSFQLMNNSCSVPMDTDWDTKLLKRPSVCFQRGMHLCLISCKKKILSDDASPPAPVQDKNKE